MEERSEITMENVDVKCRIESNKVIKGKYPKNIVELQLAQYLSKTATNVTFAASHSSRKNSRIFPMPPDEEFHVQEDEMKGIETEEKITETIETDRRSIFIPNKHQKKPILVRKKERIATTIRKIFERKKAARVPMNIAEPTSAGNEGNFLESNHPMEEMTEIIEINQEELECEMCNGQSLEEIITIIRVCMKCRRRSLMEKPKCSKFCITKWLASSLLVLMLIAIIILSYFLERSIVKNGELKETNDILNGEYKSAIEDIYYMKKQFSETQMQTSILSQVVESYEKEEPIVLLKTKLEKCEISINQIKEDTTQCVNQQTKVHQDYEEIVEQINSWVDKGHVVHRNKPTISMNDNLKNNLKALEFLPSDLAKSTHQTAIIKYLKENILTQILHSSQYYLNQLQNYFPLHPTPITEFFMVTHTKGIYLWSYDPYSNEYNSRKVTADENTVHKRGEMNKEGIYVVAGGFKDIIYNTSQVSIYNMKYYEQPDQNIKLLASFNPTDNVPTDCFFFQPTIAMCCYWPGGLYTYNLTDLNSITETLINEETKTEMKDVRSCMLTQDRHHILLGGYKMIYILDTKGENLITHRFGYGTKDYVWQMAEIRPNIIISANEDKYWVHDFRDIHNIPSSRKLSSSGYYYTVIPLKSGPGDFAMGSKLSDSTDGDVNIAYLEDYNENLLYKVNKAVSCRVTEECIHSIKEIENGAIIFNGYSQMCISYYVAPFSDERQVNKCWSHHSSNVKDYLAVPQSTQYSIFYDLQFIIRLQSQGISYIFKVFN